MYFYPGAGYLGVSCPATQFVGHLPNIRHAWLYLWVIDCTRDKFPAAPEDCYAVTKWIATHTHEINADPNRIAVGGESAGGNLAAVVTLMARDRQGLALCIQIMIYGETDYYEPGIVSYNTYAHGYTLALREVTTKLATAFAPSRV